MSLVGPRSFSIVIPTKNRPEQLDACLRAIGDLDFPPDRFEVIVVDDGGDRPAAPIVEMYRSKFRVRSARIEGRGPAVARNRGAAMASGDTLVFTDDDCLLDAAYLSAIEARLAHEPHIGIGGRTLNALTDSVCATASGCLIDFLFDYFNRNPDTAHFLTSNNLALPAAGFHELGGFDKRFTMACGEDRDLCARWVESGRLLRFEPAALAYHHHDLTFWGFCRQHLNYGRGAYQFHRNRARVLGMPAQHEPLNFYLKVLAMAFGLPARRWPLRMFGLLALSQVLNVAGYMVEGFRSQRSNGCDTQPG
jgi:glycosyltransferase involved in cell wall biosynthesis